ncbi:MAG TPA: VOC family protein [candidate division Zixibacteria bacterium]|nr:VOC family protein [candidate division Zixibacteria bacterium]
MSIEAIDHVGVVVSDMDRSVRFYTELLGFSLLARYRPESPYQKEIAYLKFPGASDAKLELYSLKQPSAEPSYERRVGMREIALRVPDVGAELERLRRAGAEVLSEPVYTEAPGLPPDSPVRRRTRGAIKGPDGVIVGLYRWG